MKRNLAIALLTVFFLVGCKSKSVTNTKLDNKTEVALKGNWTISSVTFPGSEYFKVNSFQIADSKCFVGSTWKLVSNNNKGEMAINSPSCASFESPITWFVNKEGNFVMKVLNAGDKAKKVKEGYVLQVANVSESSFQLIDRVDIGGKLTDVVYQFNKN
jgi:hypothetical protein